MEPGGAIAGCFALRLRPPVGSLGVPSPSLVSEIFFRKFPIPIADSRKAAPLIASKERYLANSCAVGFR